MPYNVVDVIPICTGAASPGGAAFQDVSPAFGPRSTPAVSAPDERSTAKRCVSKKLMAQDPRHPGEDDPDQGVVTKTRPKVKRPSMYRVLLLNDDYTPMEFVVAVLERFFSKGREEATRIMLHVHHHGVGECGVFTYEVAETKVTQVMDFARKNQHPLQCVMEKQ